MEKLAIVITWFNPNKENIKNAIKNLLSLNFLYIYIVDNSQNDNSELLKEFSNCTYLQNFNKGRIAGALNLGCTKALEDGFLWCMTLDQDSIFEKEMLKKYLELFEKYKSQKDVVSFGTKVKNLNEYEHFTKIFRRKVLRPIKRFFIPYKEIQKPEFEYCKNMTIASGNIINLQTFKDLNGFDEYLFIDEVDSDFCHKIIHSNKKIMIFPEIILNQHFGEKIPFSILPKLRPVYTDFRYFYVFRNKFIMGYRYPEQKKALTNI